MPIKSGSTIAYSGNGTKRAQGSTVWENYKLEYLNSYYMTSVNHAGWGKSTTLDIGGPWWLLKSTYTVAPVHWQETRWIGPVCASGGGNGVPNPYSVSPASNSQLDADGTTAIAAVEPTNPNFEMSTALGEAYQALPSGVGFDTFYSRSKKFRDLYRNLGSEYLNIQFGWLPFVADLRKFALAVRDSDKIIKSYQRGSDKRIKRRYVFPTVVDQQSGPGSIRLSNQSASTFGGSYSMSRKTDKWFEGAFRYHVPVGSGVQGKLSEYRTYADKILGLQLTPELVWNLTPWSWAADWFGNMNAVMHNISSLGSDGLAMSYGYTMQQIVAEENYSTFTPFGATSLTKRTVSKQRRGATPYGFGLQLEQLSATQIAVMAALGLTRG